MGAWLQLCRAGHSYPDLEVRESSSTCASGDSGITSSFIFSSSAAVAFISASIFCWISSCMTRGQCLPDTEDHPVCPLNAH